MKFKQQILINLSLFLIALCFQPISAQENNKKVIDSLYLIVNNANYNDINKVDSYLKLSIIFLRENTDLAIFYVEKGKLLAEKNKDVKMVVKCLIQLARIKEVQNELKGALTYLNEADKLYKDLDKDYIYLTVCNYQGMYYEIVSNYDMSIEKFLLGLKLANTLNNQDFKAVFLTNLSIAYAKVNQFEKSLTTILEGSAIYNEIGTRDQYSQSLIYLGQAYINLGKYDLAKEHLNNARKFYEKINGHILLSDIYSGLGKISMDTGNQEEALEFLLIAQHHELEMIGYNAEQNFKLALVNNNLGNIYFYFKNYSQAIQQFRSSISLGKKIESNEVLKESYKGLYSSYLGLKKLDSVSHYLDLFIPVSDSLIAEKYNEKIDALNYEYQLHQEKEKFDNEKKLLILEKKRHQLKDIIMISLSFLLILIVGFFWYAQRNQLNKSKLRSQNLSLEKDNLAFSLEHKNKELISTVLSLIERNKFISNISDNLEKINSEEEKIDLKKIKDTIRNIDKTTNKKLWKEFELSYVEVHNEFFQKLSKKSSKLTSNDRRLCALIMLNMSIKEISSITYQSPQSIKIARYRLRKKLHLVKNENLTSFLNNI